MSRIQPPQFLSDLYRDLRDRRLLLPIAALLVAIAVAPIGLGSSAPESAPPPPPVAIDAGSPVEPAVLAKQAGIRDYRKRLEALKSTNPFEQKFSAPPPQSVAIDGGTEGTAPIESIAAGEAPTAAAVASSDPSLSQSAVTSGPAPPVDPSTAQTQQDPAGAGNPAPEPAIRYYSSRVDVTLGPVGETKGIEGVHALEMLPDKQRPLVLFLGISESGDSAIFLVSPDLTVADGEGSCSPKPRSECQFLILKEGESTYLDDAANQQRYRFGLDAIDLVRVPEPAGLDPSDGSPDRSERAILGAGL